MAESMAGTLPAAAKAWGMLRGKEGLSESELMAGMMEDVGKGKVKSAEFVPLLAQVFSQQAQPKLGVMSDMSIAWQGRFGSARADMMQAFNKAGGDKAFRAVWKGLADVFKELTPLMPVLAKGFREIGTSISSSMVNTLRGFKDILKDISAISGMDIKDLTLWTGVLAAAGMAIATSWGRAALGLLLAYAVIEDMMAMFSGREDVFTLKDYFNEMLGTDLNAPDWLDDLKDKLAGVLAVATEIVAVLAALRFIGIKVPKLPTGGKGGKGSTKGGSTKGGSSSSKGGSSGKTSGTTLRTPADTAKGQNQGHSWERLKGAISSAGKDGFQLGKRLPLAMIGYGAYETAKVVYDKKLSPEARQATKDAAARSAALNEQLLEMGVTPQAHNKVLGRLPTESFTTPLGWEPDYNSPYLNRVYPTRGGGLESFIQEFNRSSSEDTLDKIRRDILENKTPSQTNITTPKVEVIVNYTGSNDSEEVGNVVKDKVQEVLTSWVSLAKTAYETP